MIGFFLAGERSWQVYVCDTPHTHPIQAVMAVRWVDGTYRHGCPDCVVNWSDGRGIIDAERLETWRALAEIHKHSYILEGRMAKQKHQEEAEKRVHDKIAHAKGRPATGRGSVRVSVVRDGLAAVLENAKAAPDLASAKAALGDFESNLDGFLEACK